MVAFANRPPSLIVVAAVLLIAIVALSVLGLQPWIEPVLAASWRRGG